MISLIILQRYLLMLTLSVISRHLLIDWGRVEVVMAWHQGTDSQQSPATS